jgi:transposase
MILEYIRLNNQLLKIMANKTLAMQKIRQILLFLKRDLSERGIAEQTGVSRPTIHSYKGIFDTSGFDYDTLLKLKDPELYELVKTKKKGPDLTPDVRKLYFLEQADYFISELGRVGVTRLLLWQEYLKEYPEGFSYSRFCELLDIQINLKSPTMVFKHNPGELLEIDFAGSKLSYVATSTGEIIACPVLIGVLPFSGFGYAKALPDASLAQVIPALNDILNYFGGVPLNARSDNMKQWVVRSCRYEPTFPQALEQWALHNHIGLLATRVRAPKDKPSVENQVKITYRRVYATIRNETFYSIQELNQGIRKALEAHHDINFQKKSFSRRELFTGQELPVLQGLPEHPYQFNHLTRAKVQKNYHVVMGEDWHFYSVPYHHVGKEVNIIYDTECVEIYYQLERIAVHRRNYKKHGITTLLEHMPEHHRKMAVQRGWTPDYYLKQAADNGPHTKEFFEKLMKSKISVHQAYGPFLGIMRLIKQYGGPRVEAACKRALTGNRYNYKVVATILENKMDRIEESPPEKSPMPHHENLRGPQAFVNKMKH